MSDLLEVRELHSGYGETEILREIHLCVKRGEALAILGKNGAGKTTLLKTILDIVPRHQGTIVFDGQSLSDEKAYRRFRRQVGYAPQDNALFGSMTVAENLRLGDPTIDRRSYAARCAEIFEVFPWMSDRGEQESGTLSGGEQKMLILARAMMKRPPLLLIDEISEGIQPSVRSRLVDVLSAERDERGTTLVIVEQNLDFTFELANRYHLIDRGMFVGEGTVADPNAQSVVRKHLEV